MAAKKLYCENCGYEWIPKGASPRVPTLCPYCGKNNSVILAEEIFKKL